MKALLTLFFLITTSVISHAQEYQWVRLPGGPNNAIRHEDMYFINESTGWVIGGIGLYKTTNKGINWLAQSVFNEGGLSGRCITFVDSLTGLIGGISQIGERSIMYRSTNGGTNWQPVLNLPVSYQTHGICGFYTVQNTIYACGRYNSPAIILKSTDKGETWSLLNLENRANTLVDCYFINKDSGFVAGGIGDIQNNTIKPVVLFTSNGGANWVTKFTGSRTKEWCWKIDFPSRDTGYISVETVESHGSIFLKTIDGGDTWVEKPFIPQPFDQEGIGFINNQTGWLGGYGTNFDGSTYKTTDGGETWTQDNFGIFLNRFRKINDSLSYYLGRWVYRYSPDTAVAINPVSNTIPADYSISQNFPNPFNPVTYIRFYLPKKLNTKLVVYNISGKKIASLLNESLYPGEYKIKWDASAYPSGIYYYKITAGDYTETKKMVLLK